MSVLDCMIDPLSASGHVRVYYHVLDGDERGMSPAQDGFNTTSKSPLQILAKSGNKASAVLLRPTCWLHLQIVIIKN